ncbi:MAG: hypothetical protein QXQ39_06545 [Conexivisphaerales archaeon]
MTSSTDISQRSSHEDDDDGQTVSDSKTNRPIVEVIKKFKFQSSRSACYTVSIHNILQELGSRYNENNIILSEKKINEITKFKDPIGPKLEIVVRNLNKAISKYGYYSSERSEATFNDLLRILKDEQCSYPLVGLAYSYLVVERKLFKDNTSINNLPDHVVTVLVMNEERTIFHDPYGSFVRAPEQGLPKGVFSLSTPKFLDEYWKKALFSCWFFYIQRKGKMGEQLEKYFPS